MRESKRIHALLLCAAFVLMLLVSSAFIVHEANHDCVGEDCPICQIIAANGELLRLMGAALILLMAMLLLTRENGIPHFMERRKAFASETLVSWKIRLND